MKKVLILLVIAIYVYKLYVYAMKEVDANLNSLKEW